MNNAAAVPRDATLLDAQTIDTSEEELREAFETNLFGVLLLTHDLLPLLRKSDAGRIVNLSSTLGSLTLHEQNAPEIAYTNVSPTTLPKLPSICSPFTWPRS